MVPLRNVLRENSIKTSCNYRVRLRCVSLGNQDVIRRVKVAAVALLNAGDRVVSRPMRKNIIPRREGSQRGNPVGMGAFASVHCPRGYPRKKASVASTNAALASRKTGPCPPFGTTQRAERGIARYIPTANSTG